MRERLIEGLENLRARVTRLGADLWEVYGETRQIRSVDPIRTEDAWVRGTVEPDGGSRTTSETCGWAVRLKKAGRLIFVPGTAETDIIGRLDAAVRDPLSFPETDWEGPAFLDPHHLPIAPDARWTREPPEVRLKVLREISVVPILSYRESRRERVLANSHGLRAQDEATYYEVWSADRPLSLHRSFGALLDDLLRNYHRVLRAVRGAPRLAEVAPCRETPWLLSADASVTLLGALLVAARRQSALPPSVSSEIDLVDDGVLPGGFATDAFDGQGGKTERAVIYQNGRPPLLRSLMHRGREPAEGHCPMPTVWAHWRRETVHHCPRPGYLNLLIPPGQIPAEEVLEGLPEAIYVSEIRATISKDGSRMRLTGSGRRMNYGEAGESVIMLLDGGAPEEVWNRVTARCRDTEVTGCLGAPPILIDTRKWGERE
jgi:hypothetical protein